ncbi:MAG: endolytic transglycosylase MltG [Candidatus Aminicenantes bacterium]
MILKIIKISLLLASALLLFFTTWFWLEFYLPPKTESKRVLFEVEKGTKAEAIAQNLKQEEIIRKKWPFLLAYKLFFFRSTLKAGEYEFVLPVSSKHVLNTIMEGKIYLHPLTIPEGLTQREIAQQVEFLHWINAQKFLQACSETEVISSWDEKASTLEGYLFPETYHFPKGTSGNTMVKTMVSQFKKSFTEEMKKRAARLGMSIREVVILASLVEKETSVPEEKNLVSAVFHNRLNRGMKLDCDPTIIYALKQKDQFQDRLRTKDLKLDSPYNTYLYPGLPPGPICNPGLESIKAALFPAEEDYLYFVSKNDGTHHFSRTLEDHLKAVRKYQK